MNNDFTGGSHEKIVFGVDCFFGFAGIPLGALAGDFDGSKPLLCAVKKAFECTAADGCQERTVESVNIPQFLQIDVEQKKITAHDGRGKGRNTEIERIEHIDGKLMIQGAEDGVENVRDGLSWSLSVSEETGRMTLTASGDELGFVVFGACTTY